MLYPDEGAGRFRGVNFQTQQCQRQPGHELNRLPGDVQCGAVFGRSGHFAHVGKEHCAIRLGRRVVLLAPKQRSQSITSVSLIGCSSDIRQQRPRFVGANAVASNPSTMA